MAIKETVVRRILIQKILRLLILSSVLYVFSICTLFAQTAEAEIVPSAESGAAVVPDEVAVGAANAAANAIDETLSLPSLSDALSRLDSEARQSLVRGELLSANNSDGGDVMPYVPAGSIIAQKLASAPQGKDGFAVASVSLIPYPQSWNGLNRDERMLRLYNALGKISTQKGITYISRRAGYKPVELFAESYYIADADKKSAALPDIYTAKIPPSETRYVFQEDSSFGENTYRHTYTTAGGEIFVEITNCTPMKYHGFTCLKSEEMEMCISILPLQEGILVSSAAVVTGHRTTVTVIFVRVDLADSFKRRTDALHEWYKSLIESED